MGEHQAVDTKGERVVQVVTDEAIDRILSRFKVQKEQPNFGGLLIDWEHFSYDSEKKSEAAGWIQNVQRRADGVWGQIRWSEAGLRDVKGGLYRFISPSLDYEVISGNRVRPIALTDAGLTNVPGFKTLTPLSNREGDGRLANQETGGTKMEWLKELLLKVLGLAGDASDDDIRAAAAKLMPVEDQQALKEEKETLETQNKELEKELVEHDLADFADVIEKPEDVREGLVKNRAATLKVLRGLKKPATAPTIVHNRAAAKRPAGSPLDGGGKAEKSLSQQQQAAVSEYRVRNRCSFQEAWEGAKREKPELFVPAKQEG